MKRIISCLLVLLLTIGTVSIFADNNASFEYKDTEYTLAPWTFWQTGVTCDGWNPFELSAFERVYIPDDSENYADSTPGSDFNPREYTNKNWFKHGDISSGRGDSEPREVTVKGVSHGYVATIESNGWTAKWIPDETETNEETTSFVPYLIDNNPYTVRSWTSVSGLQNSEQYACQFEAFIEPGSYMNKQEGKEYTDVKYARIVGSSPEGEVLFKKEIAITEGETTFTFDFDTGDFDQVRVEMMYGAFLKTGPVVEHEEVVWHGTIHVEDFRIVKREEVTTETSTEDITSIPTDQSQEITTSKDEVITTVNVTTTSNNLKEFKFSSVKSKKKKSLKLKWLKIKGVNGYQIAYSKNKKFKKSTFKLFKQNKTSFTIKGLKSKKKVYVRGRTFIKENRTRKFGPWSKPKKVKIR